jgi:hypothetical protein
MSVSATGVVALQIFMTSADLYLIPLAPASGQPTGVTRRLTHDGRMKYLSRVAGGDDGNTYFSVDDRASQTQSLYALDLENGKQTLIAGVPYMAQAVVSPDGRQIAYSVPKGDFYSIRVGNAGGSADSARPLCTDCGQALLFSGDGRFLLYQPEARSRFDPKLKSTIRLLEVSSRKNKPWLEHPSDSINHIGTFGENAGWVTFEVLPVGSQSGGHRYIVPWSEEPVPSEWVEVKLPADSKYSSYGNFFQFFQNAKLMGIRFDAKRRALSNPSEVKYVTGSGETLKPTDDWGIRGRGLVFSRGYITKSVWLTKLPK